MKVLVFDGCNKQVWLKHGETLLQVVQTALEEPRKAIVLPDSWLQSPAHNTPAGYKTHGDWMRGESEEWARLIFITEEHKDWIGHFESLHEALK